MKIFKELNKLGYKHYTEYTVEELDDLPLDSEERIMEQAMVFRWFREKYGLEGLILPQSQGAVIDREPIYFIAIISYENELMKELFNSTNQEDLLHYNPREEAELACLIKLIEIVKTK